MNPIIFFFAGGVMMLMTFLLLAPILKYGPGFSFLIFVFSAFGFSLMSFVFTFNINPEVRIFIPLGYVFTFVFPLLVLKIINKLNLGEKLVNPQNNTNLLLIYWFIYILAASILTLPDLSTLRFMINILPIFVYGLVFGWLGPEVTYRIINGAHRSIKALILEVFFLFSIAGLHSLFEADPILQLLMMDTGAVLIIVFISVPSMLLSRIILTSLNKINKASANQDGL